MLPTLLHHLEQHHYHTHDPILHLHNHSIVTLLHNHDENHLTTLTINLDHNQATLRLSLYHTTTHPPGHEPHTTITHTPTIVLDLNNPESIDQLDHYLSQNNHHTT